VSFLRRLSTRVTAVFGRLIRRRTSGGGLAPLGPESPTTAYPQPALQLRRVPPQSPAAQEAQAAAQAATAPADIPFEVLGKAGSPLATRPMPRVVGDTAPDEVSTDPRGDARHLRPTDKVPVPPYDPLAETDVKLQHGAASELWFNPGATALATALSTSDVALQRAIDLLVREKMVVFDVGAGYGLLSLVAARRCLDGRVIAFEPLPDYGALLERSASKNGMHHVQLERVALADREGEARLQLSRLPGHSRLETAGLPPEPAGFMAVQVRTVDQVVAKNAVPPPDLLVVDVEGAEVSVLRGAAHVLRAARPIVVLSLHGTGAAITKLLDSYGLEAYALGGGDPRPPSVSHRWAVGFPRERVHLQTYVGPLTHRAIVEPDRVR
jgi:FkbM family methyltransferase